MTEIKKLNGFPIDEALTDGTVAVDLLTFVETPFVRKKNLDLVSKIYQSFQSVKCSQAIPIYYTFALMSYWNLINNVRFQIPCDPKAHLPNVWIMALAKSGAAKSTTVGIINSLLPKYDKTTILQPSFQAPASAASIIEQFHNQKIHFWFEDEAAQWLKRVETPNDSLSAAKGPLLKAKNGESISYNTKTEGSKIIDNPQMSLFWVNTIAGMKTALSAQSMVDGLASRITTVVAENRSEQSSNYFDINEIFEMGLEADFERLFDQQISGNHYTFSNAAANTYDKTIHFYRAKPFANMQGEDNYLEPFFDRYAFEAHKYAIFHHQMHHKTGTEIDDESMSFGLSVVAFNLKSFLRFMWLRDGRKQAAFNTIEERHKAQQERIKSFVQASHGVNGFSVRSLTRKFGIKREEMMLCLRDLAKDDKQFSLCLHFLTRKKSKSKKTIAYQVATNETAITP